MLKFFDQSSDYFESIKKIFYSLFKLVVDEIKEPVLFFADLIVNKIILQNDLTLNQNSF